MAPRVLSWLLLQVALLLDAAQAQGHSMLRISPPELVAQVGGKVTLRCEVLTRSYSGCSWLFQPLGPARVPTFLMYQSGASPKLAPRMDAKRLDGTKSGHTYTLILSKFRPQDEGYYFCSIFSNSIIYFSPFLLVSQPAAPSTKPPPPSPPPPPAPNTPSPSVRPEICVLPKGAEGAASWLDLTCDVYVWAPLAGTCALLLLSLVLAVFCLRRSRRRVCRCPRPQVRPRGKPNPSGKLT